MELAFIGVNQGFTLNSTDKIMLEFIRNKVDIYISLHTHNKIVVAECWWLMGRDDLTIIKNRIFLT